MMVDLVSQVSLDSLFLVEVATFIVTADTAVNINLTCSCSLFL